MGNAPDPVPRLKLPDLDAYVKKEAEKAARQREADIAALLSRIENGTSQLSVRPGWNDPRPKLGPGDPLLTQIYESDPSNWVMMSLQKKAEADYQETLHRQTMGYLNDLAHTEAGFKLLADLDAAPTRTHVVGASGKFNETTVDDPQKAYTRPDGTPSTGSGAWIGMNPRLTTFALPGEAEQPWMTERERYGMYHELVHAYHAEHGTVARGDHGGQPNAEWQAIGLGPYVSEPVSENAIRFQMGKDLRPDASRATY